MSTVIDILLGIGLAFAAAITIVLMVAGAAVTIVDRLPARPHRSGGSR